jgi:hypothetical protein
MRNFIQVDFVCSLLLTLFPLGVTAFFVVVKTISDCESDESEKNSLYAIESCNVFTFSVLDSRDTEPCNAVVHVEGRDGAGRSVHCPVLVRLLLARAALPQANGVWRRVKDVHALKRERLVCYRERSH